MNLKMMMTLSTLATLSYAEVNLKEANFYEKKDKTKTFFKYNDFVLELSSDPHSKVEMKKMIVKEIQDHILKTSPDMNVEAAYDKAMNEYKNVHILGVSATTQKYLKDEMKVNLNKMKHQKLENRLNMTKYVYPAKDKQNLKLNQQDVVALLKDKGIENNEAFLYKDEIIIVGRDLDDKEFTRKFLAELKDRKINIDDVNDKNLQGIDISKLEEIGIDVDKQILRSKGVDLNNICEHSEGNSILLCGKNKYLKANDPVSQSLSALAPIREHVLKEYSKVIKGKSFDELKGTLAGVDNQDVFLRKLLADIEEVEKGGHPYDGFLENGQKVVFKGELYKKVSQIDSRFSPFQKFDDQLDASGIGERGEQLSADSDGSGSSSQ